MLPKTKVILQIVALLFVFQQSAFAHFINDEMDQKRELKISEKVEIQAEVEKPAKIETPVKSKPKTRDLGYINFMKDQSFYDVMDRAEKENKAIFIDFYASWCSPCKMMDMEVFNDSSVANYMNSNFINFKVDINTRTGNNVAYRYDVTLLPTLLIVTPKGDIIAKETGVLSPEEFVAFAKNAVIY